MSAQNAAGARVRDSLNNGVHPAAVTADSEETVEHAEGESRHREEAIAAMASL